MDTIILDMEWNQPFSKKRMMKSPVCLTGEIIQIGAVKLDKNYCIVDTFKIMITPQYYTKMHKKVSDLTKITTEELQYGFSFPTAFAALKYFRAWCGKEFVFLAWGTDDITTLHANLALHGLDSAWIPESYDIQLIFDEQITKEKRQVSLSDAAKK